MSSISSAGQAGELEEIRLYLFTFSARSEATERDAVRHLRDAAANTARALNVNLKSTIAAARPFRFLGGDAGVQIRRDTHGGSGLRADFRRMEEQ